MIRFSCKACGKPQSRPDSAAGTLVFCVCGQSNRVPWEGDAPDEPIDVDAAPEPEPERVPRRRPLWDRPAPLRRDPDSCFNHPDTARQCECAECGESFCSRCVVSFQERMLCGPCKNFRLRAQDRPRQPSACAIVSPILALAGSPVAFCMSFIPAALPDSNVVWVLILSLLGMILPLVALFLGWKGLRDIDANPRLSGARLAITGMTTAAVSLLWCITIAWIGTFRNVGG